MIAAAFFNIIIGLIIIYQWFISLSKGNVPELEISPKSIFTHTVAEMVTAVSLIISGVLLLQEKHKGYNLYLFSTGMLVYTLINSAGYFWDKKNYRVVFVFGFLLILTTAIFLYLLLK